MIKRLTEEVEIGKDLSGHGQENHGFQGFVEVLPARMDWYTSLSWLITG